MSATPHDQQVLTQEIFPVLLKGGHFDNLGHYVNEADVMADVVKYRAFIGGLEPLKNVGPYPKLAAYHPEVDIAGRLKASIAVPLGRGPFPVIVQCHGNAGRAGSPYSYRRYSQDLAAGGYVVVTPDYRLAPENPPQAAVDDCRTAAVWAKAHVSDYNGDIGRLVITGDSAGGGLAAQLLFSLLDDPAAPQPKAFVGTDGFYQAVMDRIKPGIRLPQMLLMSGSGDFALEPGLQLALALRKSGLDFEMHILDSMPHDALKFPHLEAAVQGKQIIFDYLRARI